MITAIRKMITSRVGAIVALLFIALVGLLFAVSDVSNLGLGGPSVGNGDVAKVGDRTITLVELRRRLDNGLAQARQQQPGLTMQQYIAAGGLDRTLEQVTDLAALEQYGRKLGIGMSPEAVELAITRDPSFAGLTGSFDQRTFDQVIAAQGLSAQDVRKQVAASGIVRQLLAPSGQIGAIPQGVTLPYASLLLEERTGQASFIPASRFAPTRAPTEAELQTYFNRQRARYAIAERRVIRYALIDQSSLPAPAAITPAEIQAEYRANAASYAAQETRRLSQVIIGNRATADRVAAAARSGSLADAARAAGLQASVVTPANQAAFASASSAAIARDVFAANQGAVVGPMQVPLGFMVVEVLEVNRRPARSLAQATPEITASLVTRKRREALDNAFNRAQDALTNGASVTEVANDMGLTVVTTPALLENGTAPGNASWRPTPIIEPIVRTAFQIDEGQPGQMARVMGDEQFALIDVAEYLPVAPPPLAEIRERVIADWRQAEGARAARDRARRILEAVERGSSLAEATAAQGVPGSVQTISGRRIGMVNGQGRLPPEVALMFSMARGSVKTLELPGGTGWMVIRLTSTQRGDATGNQQLLAAVEQQFGQALAGEYIEILARAARREFPVERNQAVIDRLRAELTGAATPATN